VFQVIAWWRANLSAWVLGFREAASDFTTSFDGDLIETYDRGRAFGRAIRGYHD